MTTRLISFFRTLTDILSKKELIFHNSFRQFPRQSASKGGTTLKLVGYQPLSATLAVSGNRAKLLDVIASKQGTLTIVPVAET